VTATDRGVLSFRTAGEGRPLLLIHGLLVNGAMFDPIVPLLDPQRALIIPDLRGHGLSQALPPPYSVAQHAADLGRLLDELDVSRTDVLGYSQGGAVAQQFARDYPERVNDLFLVCTYACNRITRREKLEAGLMPWSIRLLGVRLVANLMANGATELSNEQAAHLGAMIAANGKAQALGAIDALRTFDSRAWLGDVRCPTRVIAGAADTAVPAHHAELLRRGIPTAELRIIEGAGHTLICTHPQQLVEIVEQPWAAARPTAPVL
jgi:3-oxoadipate enol-lactonase